jgi:hypothetical protein
LKDHFDPTCLRRNAVVDQIGYRHGKVITHRPERLDHRASAGRSKDGLGMWWHGARNIPRRHSVTLGIVDDSWLSRD